MSRDKQYKYIHKYPNEKFCYGVAIPKNPEGVTETLYFQTLDEAICKRNEMGLNMWGEYWDAVRSGYIDTVKSPTASVTVRKEKSQKGHYGWLVRYNKLEDSKQVKKYFACNKYGDVKAEKLARQYAQIQTDIRVEALKNWNPRIVRYGKNK